MLLQAENHILKDVGSNKLWLYVVIINPCQNYFKDFLMDEIDVEVDYFQLFDEQIKLSLIVRLMKKMKHGVCLLNWKALRSITKHRFESIHKMVRLKRKIWWIMMMSDDRWWSWTHKVHGYTVWILWQSKAFNQTTSILRKSWIICLWLDPFNEILQVAVRLATFFNIKGCHFLELHSPGFEFFINEQLIHLILNFFP